MSIFLSNGSGKTTLAMSILWALTGSLDARPMQDAKVSDVVHQESKVK
jgi:DNA repair exonuclease SbcCD ATPase subunit